MVRIFFLPYLGNRSKSEPNHTYYHFPKYCRFLLNHPVYTAIDTYCAFQLTVCWPAGQQTVNWKAEHVPIPVYIQYTSWWLATNMPEICRGWLTKLIEDKFCIKLVFVTRIIFLRLILVLLYRVRLEVSRCLLSSVYQTKVCMPSLSPVCYDRYTPPPLLFSPWPDYPNNIWWSVCITKLVVQFAPAFNCFTSSQTQLWKRRLYQWYLRQWTMATLAHHLLQT